VSILADLQMKSTLERSSLLAESVLVALERARLLQTRSVHQARFVVLQSARVPSILVEMGFISNRNDRKRLRDPAFIERFARSLKDGILAYLTRVGGPVAGASRP
jgi:N-acetylmuramoyl-L-alanine amidase